MNKLLRQPPKPMQYLLLKDKRKPFKQMKKMEKASTEM